MAQLGHGQEPCRPFPQDNGVAGRKTAAFVCEHSRPTAYAKGVPFVVATGHGSESVAVEMMKRLRFMAGSQVLVGV